MNAIEAYDKLTELNNRISALNDAYTILWKEFDNRTIALELNKIQAELEKVRTDLVSKLSAVNL